MIEFAFLKRYSFQTPERRINKSQYRYNFISPSKNRCYLNRVFVAKMQRKVLINKYLEVETYNMVRFKKGEVK